MSNLTEAAVREALKAVRPPDLPKDLVSLQMVKAVRVDAAAGRADVEIELPTPACPVRDDITAAVRAALAPLGARDTAVAFSAVVVGRPLRSDATRVREVKNIIAVAAGKGGVGKSTVSTNLALALQAHGATVGMLDADIYGPSLPQMLGPASHPAGTSPEQRLLPAVHHGLKVMSVGFFVERQGAVVWRGPMVHKLLQQFLEDVDWGPLDYLVMDLPPGTGDAQLSLSQLVPISGAVMVTTPQEVALIDVEKAASMLRRVEVPILGVVENMSEYVCPACGHHDAIFAEGGGQRLADGLAVPLLGKLPINPQIRHGGDAGLPVVRGAPATEVAGRFMDIAARVAWKLAGMHLAGPRRAPGLVAIS